MIDGASFIKQVRMYYITRHITYCKITEFRINLYLVSIINKLSHGFLLTICVSFYTFDLKIDILHLAKKLLIV